MKDTLNKLGDSGPPTLIKLISNWVEGDPVLKGHFALLDYSKPIPAPVPSGTGLVAIECITKPRPKQYAPVYCCKIYDDRAEITYGFGATYQFDVRYPLFFPKLRAHLFDVHNKHWISCDTHLY